MEQFDNPESSLHQAGRLIDGIQQIVLVFLADVGYDEYLMFLC